MTAEEATSGLDLARLAPSDRPYLVLNMVATVDGHVTIDGRSGPIGGEADRELFHGLRTQADAVMAGAGTVRTERYGRIVRSAERRARREREGLAADPLAVIVSGSLDLPSDLPLLQDEHSRVAILTGAHGRTLGEPRARVDYVAGAAARELELRPLLGALRRELGVRSIVCEGGPRLNAALLREGVVDELFLSLAPLITGGEGPALVEGPPLPGATKLALVWLLEADGALFARYRVER